MTKTQISERDLKRLDVTDGWVPVDGKDIEPYDIISIARHGEPASEHLAVTAAYIIEKVMMIDVIDAP